MNGFESRFQRLELKFLIDEPRADLIRRQIEPYCAIDPHSLDHPRRDDGHIGYRISSLYLDTPSLAFHHAKERGDADRVKLRVRTYSPTSPATLEVKRRHSDVIDKIRAVVDRGRVERSIDGLLGDFDDVDEHTQAFLHKLGLMVATSGATPTLTVQYDREAYASVVDHYARVTFDRRIRARRTDIWDLSPPEDENWCLFDDFWNTNHVTYPVVMEIKCRQAVPLWLIELIKRNNLSRISFSKYSIGISLTGERLGHRQNYYRSAKVMR
jgi:hypothetical protein